MPLFKKPVPAQQTHSERLALAQSHKDGADQLVETAARALADASDHLAEVSKAAYEEASQLSLISNVAATQSNEALNRSSALNKLLG